MDQHFESETAFVAVRVVAYNRPIIPVQRSVAIPALIVTRHHTLASVRIADPRTVARAPRESARTRPHICHPRQNDAI